MRDLPAGDGDAPVSAVSSPAIRRRVVDLPQPDGPSRATNSASPVSKLTWSTARTPPHSLTRLSTAIPGKSFLPAFAALQAKTNFFLILSGSGGSCACVSALVTM